MARVFVDVQQILPLPEANEYFVNLREKQAEAQAGMKAAQALGMAPSARSTSWSPTR